MSADTSTRIEDGIEWWTYDRDGWTEDECQCARCGSSAYWDECDFCGGEGASTDDDCDCYGEGCDSCVEACYWCDENGGWWRCCSSREFCDAHPMPGREHIESTALRRATTTAATRAAAREEE